MDTFITLTRLTRTHPVSMWSYFAFAFAFSLLSCSARTLNRDKSFDLKPSNPSFSTVPTVHAPRIVSLRHARTCTSASVPCPSVTLTRGMSSGLATTSYTPFSDVGTRSADVMTSGMKISPTPGYTYVSCRCVAGLSGSFGFLWDGFGRAIVKESGVVGRAGEAKSA